MPVEGRTEVSRLLQDFPSDVRTKAQPASATNAAATRPAKARRTSPGRVCRGKAAAEGRRRQEAGAADWPRCAPDRRHGSRDPDPDGRNGALWAPKRQGQGKTCCRVRVLPTERGGAGLRRVVDRNDGRFRTKGAGAAVREIMSGLPGGEARAAQDRLPGTEGTFSQNRRCTKHLDIPPKGPAAASVEESVDEVGGRPLPISAVVPVENSGHGTIQFDARLFLRLALRSAAKVELRVHQYMPVRAGLSEGISNAGTRTVVIGQCKLLRHTCRRSRSTAVSKQCRSRRGRRRKRRRTAAIAGEKTRPSTV